MWCHKILFNFFKEKIKFLKIDWLNLFIAKNGTEENRGTRTKAFNWKSWNEFKNWNCWCAQCWKGNNFHHISIYLNIFHFQSTFFNVITKSAAPAENFPFCTIDPNEARVPVPDVRFDHLCEHHKPAR